MKAAQLSIANGGCELSKMKIKKKNFFRMLAGIAVIFGLIQIAAQAADRPGRPERPGKKA